MTTDSICDGLWRNARDSIRHALDHFSEQARADPNDRDREHHNKWIVLSVHHAAECICNIRLLQLEPNHKSVRRNDSMWFPSLDRCVAHLEELRERLSDAEFALLKLLSELPDMRHKFAHRIAPERADVTIAAMCMLGLLNYIPRLTGEKASDIVWQSPPVEGDVYVAIRYSRHAEYTKFAELFVREKYPYMAACQCPECGATAVIGTTCEACFVELSSITCTSCDTEFYFADKRDIPGVCSHCGEVF